MRYGWSFICDLMMGALILVFTITTLVSLSFANGRHFGDELPLTYLHAAISWKGYIWVVGGQHKLAYRRLYRQFHGPDPERNLGADCDFHFTSGEVYKSRNGVKWELVSRPPENGLAPRVDHDLYIRDEKLFVGGGMMQYSCSENVLWTKHLMHQSTIDGKVWEPIVDEVWDENTNIGVLGVQIITKSHQCPDIQGVKAWAFFQGTSRVETLTKKPNGKDYWVRSKGGFPKLGSRRSVVCADGYLVVVDHKQVTWSEDGKNWPHENFYAGPKDNVATRGPTKGIRAGSNYNSFFFDNRFWIINGCPTNNTGDYFYYFSNKLTEIGGLNTKVLKLEWFNINGKDRNFEQIPQGFRPTPPPANGSLPVYHRRCAARTVSHNGAIFIIGGWPSVAPNDHIKARSLNEVWKLTAESHEQSTKYFFTKVSPTYDGKKIELVGSKFQNFP